MSNRTKIIVIRKKELILGAAGCGLILAMILLLAGFFRGTPSPDNETDAPPVSEQSARYIPGVYTSSLVLNDNAMDVEVVLDENHINGVSLVNLDKSAETMLPLVKPAMEDLSTQILSRQSADNVTYSKNSTYTSMVLHTAIKAALKKGEQPQRLSKT